MSVGAPELPVEPVPAPVPLPVYTPTTPATTPLPVPDVQVAPGDPDHIESFQQFLEQGREMLESHADAVCQTATTVSPAWQGEAADSYAELSEFVTLSMNNAAAKLGDASAAMRKYQTRLREDQKTGMAALKAAEDCIRQVTSERAKLKAAQAAVKTHQATLQDALARERTATHIVGGSPGASQAMAQAAAADAAAAQRALADAQRQAQAASDQLNLLGIELQLWQKMGHDAWVDAENAAMAATGSLLPILITPPPLAEIPTLPGLASDPGVSVSSCVAVPGTGTGTAGPGDGGDNDTIAKVLAALAAAALGGTLLHAAGRGGPPYADATGDPQNPRCRMKTGKDAFPVPGRAKALKGYVDSHSGSPPKGYKGNGLYTNGDNRLPPRDTSGNPITYKEYDIDPKPAPGTGGRNDDRVVIGYADGKEVSAYYSNDHYNNFTPIQ